MIELRPFASLGRFQNDWLNARHHFSFGGYDDPARRGWGALLVWNDDEIAPRSGFPTHGHRDMEIVTVMRSGAISHRDSTGGVGRLSAGGVQVMTAGRGVRHSEMNAEDTACTLFQIWITPAARDLTPRWEEKQFDPATAGQGLIPLASGQGAPGALTIHQDATVYAVRLGAGESVTHRLGAGRRAYLTSAEGTMTVDGVAVGARDGAAIADAAAITLASATGGWAVLADIPG